MHVLAFGKVAKRDSINVKVLGRRGVGFGEGRGNLSKERFPFPPPNLPLSPPKTFDFIESLLRVISAD